MLNTLLGADAMQLNYSQAKITYLGEQIKPVATVVFHPQGHQVRMESFMVVEKRQRPYSNDELPYTKYFTVTPAELTRMLSAAQPILEQANGVKPELSFAAVSEEHGRIDGREFLISEQSGREFFSKLLSALDPGNTVGKSVLRKQLNDAYPSAE